MLDEVNNSRKCVVAHEVYDFSSQVPAAFQAEPPALLGEEAVASVVLLIGFGVESPSYNRM